MKRIVTFFCTLLMTIIIFFPVDVLARQSSDKEATIYLCANDKKTNTVSPVQHDYIVNYCVTKKDKVKNLKVGNNSILKIENVEQYGIDYTIERYETGYLEGEKGEARIYFKCLKPGKTTISYKIGKKSFKEKIRVRKYENPAKKVEITGIKNGKSNNLAGMLKNQNTANITSKKNVKNAVVSVWANTSKNWKVTRVKLEDHTQGMVYMGGSDNGKNNLNLKVGLLQKDHKKTITMSFYNTKTQGTLDCTYIINPKKSK